MPASTAQTDKANLKSIHVLYLFSATTLLLIIKFGRLIGNEEGNVYVPLFLSSGVSMFGKSALFIGEIHCSSFHTHNRQRARPVYFLLLREMIKKNDDHCAKSSTQAPVTQPHQTILYNLRSTK